MLLYRDVTAAHGYCTNRITRQCADAQIRAVLYQQQLQVAVRSRVQSDKQLDYVCDDVGDAAAAGVVDVVTSATNDDHDDGSEESLMAFCSLSV